MSDRRGQGVDVVRPRSRRSATRSACRRPGSWRHRPAASGAVPAGTSNEKPLPRVETSTPSGAGGGPPLCWSPAGTPLAEPVGSPPAQLNANGPANCPIPRSGARRRRVDVGQRADRRAARLADVGGERRARASAGEAPDRPVDRAGTRQVDGGRRIEGDAAGERAAERGRDERERAEHGRRTQSRLRLTTPPQRITCTAPSPGPAHPGCR